MTPAKTDRSFWLAWGLILLVAFIVAVLAWAVANTRITIFTLQPKSAPAPAAKPTTFHDTTRQPESEHHLALASTAPRIARVVDLFSPPSRGSFRAMFDDNQPAGSRRISGARFPVPGESDTTADSRSPLPAG